MAAPVAHPSSSTMTELLGRPLLVVDPDITILPVFHKGPRHTELIKKMLRQRLHPKCFCGIMTAVKDIDPKFLSQQRKSTAALRR